ncbi:MAG: PF20097 family protein [Thermoplasmata archaeon]
MPAPLATGGDSIPNCPDCEKKMAPGFLALAGRANWVTKVGAFDASIFKGETVVGNLDVFPTGGHLRGWRCEGCGLMLLEY